MQTQTHSKTLTAAGSTNSKKKTNAYEVWDCSGLRYWAQAERGAAQPAAGSAVGNFKGGGEAITQTPAAQSITAAEAPSTTTTS